MKTLLVALWRQNRGHGAFLVFLTLVAAGTTRGIGLFAAYLWLLVAIGWISTAVRVGRTLVRGIALGGGVVDGVLRLEVTSIRGVEVVELPLPADLTLSGAVVTFPVDGTRRRVALDAQALAAVRSAIALPADPRPRLQVDVESHDRVRLRLEPVFTPFPSLAVAVFSLLCLATSGSLALYLMVSATAYEPIGVAVLAVLVGVPLVAFAASAYDVAVRIARVDLWVVGEQLVLRTHTRLRTVERRFPLVDLQGVSVSGAAVRLTVAGEEVALPLPDRSPRTRGELVGFLEEQIARAAPRRGEVPETIRRLRQPAGEREGR